MSNEYPRDEELKRIVDWPWEDIVGLLDFVRGLWWQPDWGFVRDGNKLSLHTGGWSGNESLVGALQDNAMFWAMCWQESRRGGHYKFEIPKFLQGTASHGTQSHITPR